MHGPDQGIIVGYVSDGDTDEFSAFKSFFRLQSLTRMEWFFSRRPVRERAFMGGLTSHMK